MNDNNNLEPPILTPEETWREHMGWGYTDEEKRAVEAYVGCLVATWIDPVFEPVTDPAVLARAAKLRRELGLADPPAEPLLRAVAPRQGLTGPEAAGLLVAGLAASLAVALVASLAWGFRKVLAWLRISE